jgi:nucleotide-binding universal stress UspA family protein
MSQSPNVADKSMGDCVMLALSTFRKSENAIDSAIARAREGKKLMVVYVADVNLARYFIGAEHGVTSTLKDICEADLLKQHKEVGLKHVGEIAEKAKREGIEVKTHVQIGRFAIVCLEIVQKEKPSIIVTTRSRRPEWVKKFFGAPVDELIAKATCPVVVV